MMTTAPSYFPCCHYLYFCEGTRNELYNKANPHQPAPRFVLLNENYIVVLMDVECSSFTYRTYVLRLIIHPKIPLLNYIPSTRFLRG